MKKLLVYLKDYKKETVCAPLFKLLEALFELFVPLVMAAIIDNGIGQSDEGYVLRMGLILFLLGLIGLVCSLTAQYFAAKAAVGFVAKIKNVLFRKIMLFSYRQIDSLGSSTLITRMTSDMHQVQSGVNLVLRLFLRSPFIVFGAMVMAFTVDSKAAVVFAVVIPLLVVVVFGIMLLNIPVYGKVQAKLDVLTRDTREDLAGARVIRAFRLEQNWIEEFAENNRSLKKVQLFAGRISSLMNPVTYVLINTALLVLIWIGAIRVDTGYLTQGEVVALVNYMSQILVELIKIANLIITTTKAVACGNRIQYVMDIAPEEATGDKPIDRVDKIEFQHVNFAYEGAKEDTLTDIDFTVTKGQTIGIIGGTGSGKSTLVHLLCGFYKPTVGNVTMNDIDIQEFTSRTLLGKIGIVPQRAVLFRGTIADNLRWGNEYATDEELWEALRDAQAEEFVRQKQEQLQAEVAQNGTNYSGGQRQRLTIARALATRPEILILDDSSSALDNNTDAALRKAIRALPYQPTVFLISQRTASIQYADRILVMDDGRIVGQGTHDELLEHCAVYQVIYHSQFGPIAAVQGQQEVLA